MYDLLQKLRRLLTPGEKLSLIGVALLMTCSSIMEMAGIGVLVAAITIFLAPEAVVTNSKISFITRYLNDSADPSVFIGVLASLGGLFVLKNLFSLWIIHISSR
ncbi:MAG: hypothetical protein J6R00_03250, partial [Lentisphaeria bacterium]|nr:hypothetical protein [Lentisphaeria bacterium]